ncbi:MAG: helix-turn-helix domain-containing protein, partial [Corynebacterium variabile]|nr:helix-turn-helix domain-containing protein [Corynebacterium variabile]
GQQDDSHNHRTYQTGSAQTGIGYSQLGQLAAQGGIEQVKVGNRRYLKRESLLEFIDRNTYRGWAY